jgi:glutaredoxin 3
MADAAPAIATRRVEIFSAGCNTCQRTIEQLREQIDARHEIVVHDMHNDEGAAERAEAFGIRTVPAVVVDGFLLACCKNKGPTLQELQAAGLGRPGQLHLESS